MDLLKLDRSFIPQISNIFPGSNQIIAQFLSLFFDLDARGTRYIDLNFGNGFQAKSFDHIHIFFRPAKIDVRSSEPAIFPL